MTGRRLLYVANHLEFFCSHRLPLAQAAKAAGFEVLVAAPDSPLSVELRKRGLVFQTLRMGRAAGRVWEEASVPWELLRLYRRLKPDLVHHVSLRPVLYGGLASRPAGSPAAVNSLTGLGSAFSETGLVARLRRAVLKAGLRLALGHRNSRTILQNPEDVAFLVGAGILRGSGAVLIRGSGVDMDEFRPSPEPAGTPLVVLASRMLWQKGVAEFVDAARRLRKEGVLARFALVGDTYDANPNAVPAETLAGWDREGAVEWWKFRTDMPEIFRQAALVCLPTVYGEGVPKVLIEAAACGRAIVATDWPGCREIVRRGENGLLIPPRDPSALCAALKQLLAAPQDRDRMGRRGREIALEGFSQDLVIRRTLEVYEDLLRRSRRHVAAHPPNP